MAAQIAFFLLGIAIGATIQRWIMRMSVGSLNPTICDQCRYSQKSEKKV